LVSICARFAFDQAGGHPAVLDRRPLALNAPRAARLNNGRVHDLAAHGKVAGIAKGGCADRDINHASWGRRQRLELRKRLGGVLRR
jgi:hypothetical protein